MVKIDKKYSYLLPLVAGWVLIITVLCTSGHLFGKQIHHYRRNKNSMVAEWTAEGMDADEFQRSINYFVDVKKILGYMLNGEMLSYMIGVAVSRGTDGIMWGNMDINNALEVICLFLNYAIGDITYTFARVTLDVLLAAVLISLLGTFYWFTRNKFSWKEQLFYMCLLSRPLSSLGTIFFTDASFFIDPCDIPIEQYAKIDPALRERILQATSENGIAPENVFIVEDRSINAAATSGLRFKYVFINTGALEAFSADQLMAVVHHEIGHVIYNHIPKGSIIKQLYQYAQLVAVIFLYSKVAKYYNGLAAWVTCHYMMRSMSIAFLFVYNAYVMQEDEFQADYNAYSKDEFREAHIEGEKILALQNRGFLFDYEKWTALVLTHPASYKRIKVAQEYQPNK